MPEKIENLKEWKRFLSWVNQLSPWNLWRDGDLEKPISERTLNPKVIPHLERLLK